MRWTWITGIVLFFVAVLMLAFSLPVGAFNGAGTGAYGSTGTYYSGGDGIWGGGWNQQNWPYQQQWQGQGWDNQYPYNYPGQGWGNQYPGQGYFSNCYSRCIAQGYGPNYCAQVCPV